MQEKWLPKTPEEKFAHVLEEMGEATVDAAKALRFGWDSHDPITGKTNAELLASELSDVQSAIDRFMPDLQEMITEILRRQIPKS